MQPITDLPIVVMAVQVNGYVFEFNHLGESVYLDTLEKMDEIDWINCPAYERNRAYLIAKEQLKQYEHAPTVDP